MLNAKIASADICLRNGPIRAKEVALVLSDFRGSFPEIQYEIDAKSRTVNAQAFALGMMRIVRLYGGLAFHPKASDDALVFALLHETGHLRASGGRFARDPMLACDCEADEWAISEGAAILHRGCGRELRIERAFDSLKAIVSATTGSLDKLGPTRSTDCWALDWNARKSRLSGGPDVVVSGRCYFSD